MKLVRTLAAALLAGAIALAGCSEQGGGAGDLFDHRVDYIGDNSKVTQLLDQIGFDDLGKYTIELDTEKVPHGLKLRFDEIKGAVADSAVMTKATEALGLIKNLDYVEISSGNDTFRLDKNEASEALGYSVKKLGESKDALEKFISERVSR
ncbi:protein of unknown function [Bowdeniella nasicola]|uniref:DUF4825 domain-containing protein n=1 Tax=Bowdeniella nasicola TaxID=208480 RepID=A0A1H3X3A8_9ACTO|nr:DUF4825 domain-containing protein [Bowdeniella nasicola]SDZ93740.1 protein of unknown function [Bowdeniella nasicola]